MSERHDAHPTPATYLAVFAALMLLTLLTVWASYQHLGIWNTPVALGIAITKATLVVLFFMHLRYSPKLFAIVIAASVFWLLILFGITLSDYISRSWLPIYWP
jgi:cytochrome c oxidase subunit 4